MRVPDRPPIFMGYESYFNKELNMVINHPYGSDEYWNVFYTEFSKRRSEAMIENVMNDKEKLIKDLEKVFTIDGRGRPAKALLFLEYWNLYQGTDILYNAVKKISQRKNF